MLRRHLHPQPRDVGRGQLPHTERAMAQDLEHVDLTTLASGQTIALLVSKSLPY
jgi:hypothetical protein